VAPFGRTESGSEWPSLDIGLSAAEYAKMLGVHAQAVYGWENGRFRPKPELLRKWIAVTRMS
jgi:transcriptional regulator with XRE-family HTH domain